MQSEGGARGERRAEGGTGGRVEGGTDGRFEGGVDGRVEGEEVGVREAARAAESGDVLLLDVREHEEWAYGRAPWAVHVPMGDLRQDTVPRDRPVLALCRVGSRSAAVASALAALGYDVRNVTGGMMAWAAAGLPVVRDAGEPGQVV